MHYYRLESDTTYRTLCWDGESSPSTDHLEFEFVRKFWADRSIQDWQHPPIRFRTLEEEVELEESAIAARERFAKGVSDCPFYSAAVLTLSSRACDALHDLFAESGQFLPISVPDPPATFYAFNCITVLDALDVNSSVIEYDYEDVPPRPRQVKRFVFDPLVVGTCNVFRMKWPPQFAVYVSHAVVERIERHKLTGFIAEKLSD